jgi:hypothetical protein
MFSDEYIKTDSECSCECHKHPPGTVKHIVDCCGLRILRTVKPDVIEFDSGIIERALERGHANTSTI